MRRARIGPRPGNVGVASAACGRLKEEETMPAKGAAPVANLGITARKRSHSACPLDPEGECVAFRIERATGQTTSTGYSSAPAPARWSSSTRGAAPARWSMRAPMHTGTSAATCPNMPRSRPAGCFPASRRPMPSTPK